MRCYFRINAVSKSMALTTSGRSVHHITTFIIEFGDRLSDHLYEWAAIQNYLQAKKPYSNRPHFA